MIGAPAAARFRSSRPMSAKAPRATFFTQKCIFDSYNAWSQFPASDFARNGLARKPLADIGSLFGDKKGRPRDAAGLLFVEPVTGFEPATRSLQNCCATVAPHWHVRGRESVLYDKPAERKSGKPVGFPLSVFFSGAQRLASRAYDDLKPCPFPTNSCT